MQFILESKVSFCLLFFLLCCKLKWWLFVEHVRETTPYAWCHFSWQNFLSFLQNKAGTNGHMESNGLIQNGHTKKTNWRTPTLFFFTSSFPIYRLRVLLWRIITSWQFRVSIDAPWDFEPVTGLVVCKCVLVSFDKTAGAVLLKCEHWNTVKSKSALPIRKELVIRLYSGRNSEVLWSNCDTNAVSGLFRMFPTTNTCRRIMSPGCMYMRTWRRANSLISPGIKFFIILLFFSVMFCCAFFFFAMCNKRFSREVIKNLMNKSFSLIYYERFFFILFKDSTVTLEKHNSFNEIYL